MHLPLADNIEPTRTRHRLPKCAPSHLGLYAEQTSQVDRFMGFTDVWRTEVRIGAQTSIDPLTPPAVRDRVHSDTKGLIMRHVYGPVYDELQAVVRLMFDTGIHRGHPAYDRVIEMLDTLQASFKGEH